MRFPDVDAEVLDDAAAVVREKAELVAKAQAALDTARLALHESQDALLQKGQRALAYARVFSEDNAELSTKLEGINLPRRRARARGREGTAAESTRPPRQRGERPQAPRPSSEGPPGHWSDAVRRGRLAGGLAERTRNGRGERRAAHGLSHPLTGKCPYGPVPRGGAGPSCLERGRWGAGHGLVLRMGPFLE